MGIVVGLIIILTLAFSPPATPASEPTAESTVRIETGTHGTKIGIGTVITKDNHKVYIGIGDMSHYDED